MPATGFSIGVSRLFAALKAIDSPLVAAKPHRGPVVVLVMDRDHLAHYQTLVAQLREAGIRAELYLGGAGMKAQMKYADRRQSPCVIIQGVQRARKGRGADQGLDRGRARPPAPSPRTRNGRRRVPRRFPCAKRT